MLIEGSILFGVILLTASGVPQKLYHKYSDKFSDAVFKCRSLYVNSRHTLGTLRAYDRLKFEYDKVERSLIKLEKLKRNTYINLQHVQIALKDYKSNIVHPNDDELNYIQELERTIMQLSQSYHNIVDTIELYKSLLDKINQDIYVASTHKEFNNIALNESVQHIQNITSKAKDVEYIEYLGKKNIDEQ